MNELKICHLTESFLPKVGGMQVVVDNLAKEQTAFGHKVTVACPNYPNLSGPDPSPGFEVARVFGSTKITFFFGLLPWFRLAARERFDIIHAHNAWPGGTLGVLAGKLFGAKVVITSHGRDIVTDPEIGYGSRLSPLISLIIKYTLSRANRHTIVRGSMMSSAVEAGSSRENVTVVPNFVPLPGAPSARQPGRYLLAMGRLHQIKRFELAIQAMKLINESMPDIKLKIAGSGSEGDKLKELASELGVSKSVDFVGQVDGAQKQDLLSHAWAGIVTSKLEAFPVTPLELMAQGVPVIAPNYEPFVEFIDGQNSLLMDPQKPGTIVDALEVLSVKARYSEISRLARETAAKFSPDKIVTMYNTVYEEVLINKGTQYLIKGERN